VQRHKPFPTITLGG